MCVGVCRCVVSRVSGEREVSVVSGVMGVSGMRGVSVVSGVSR